MGQVIHPSQLAEVYPEIISTNLNNDFKIYFYKEFESLLLGENKEIDTGVIEKLGHYLRGNFKDFRFQVHIKSVPFLVGFFFKEKEVRLYSPRLSSELLMIEETETVQGGIDNASVKYVELKKHVSKALSLNVLAFPTKIEININKYNLSDLLNDKKYLDLEKNIDQFKPKLVEKMNQYNTSFFERLTDYGLGLTAKYALIRIHLLKFLAILPSLDHDKDGSEVKRILVESLRRLLTDSQKAKVSEKTGQEAPLPFLLYTVFILTLKLIKIVPASPLTNSVRWSVKLMAKRFIAGESIESADKSLSKLFNTNRDVTLDQLGELVVSEKEADNYTDEVIKLVRGFKLHVKKGEINKAGINRAHVSIKVSAMCSDFNSHAFEYTYSLVAPRLKKVLIAAKEEDVFINIDAEHYDYRDLVFKIYKKVLLETTELKEFKATGIVLQAYLRDGFEHLQDILDLAKERGIIMPIRLVKGAYWDAETVHAKAHSYNAPEFLNKEETDLHFRQLIIEVFKNNPHIQLCLASHNFADHCFAHILRNEEYPTIPEIEHQCLDMTYEALSTGMAKLGWATRNYVPVGSLLVGMAYLVRRIMENSSQVGILTIMRSHKSGKSVLPPQVVHIEKKKKGMIEFDYSLTELSSGFFNISPVKLYLDSEVKWVNQAIEDFKKNDLGKNYENRLSGKIQEIHSNSDFDILVGKIQNATREDVKEHCLKLSDKYIEGDWAKAHAIYRATTLMRSAFKMLAIRNNLAALIMYESGKNLEESLGDVDEAIDFLNFYAREEVRLRKEKEGLKNRGVFGVIAPWNFPLAIPCGMTASALVAGNTVILKSAPQTPLIADVLINIFHECGVPKDVVVHLPGDGENVGDELVENPLVSGIVFTGSKNIGMKIAHKLSKKFVENKILNKRIPAKVITEMGGKNAIIVTANAELDEVVSGILYSSYAHAGQKCSAASRVIVDEKIRPKLIERLREASQDIKVGKAFDFSTKVNPVVTAYDKQRLQNAVREAVKEAEEFGGKVIIDRSLEELPGSCMGPVIIELPLNRAVNKDSYAMRELFGPVVHIIGFKKPSEALKVFNGSEYGLTGGVFSQSQDDIDYFVSKMEVGNIYINRPITGARVAIEPFGGFKLSGTGPKAGGSNYLESFHYQYEELASDKDQKFYHKEERGSDYKFSLCNRSKLSIDGRHERFCNGLFEFINQFEFHYQGIVGDDKQRVENFLDWIKNNGVEYCEGQHLNRDIPGQMSFNDYTMACEKSLMISYSNRPRINTLLQVLSAVYLGTGLTVLVRNELSFQWWSTFKNIFIKHGISSDNLDVYFSTEELLKQSLKDRGVSVLIFDASEEYIEEILNYTFDEKCNELRMKKILRPDEGFRSYEVEKFLLNFIWVRSFAINTMRHGAPMELDL